MASISFKIEMKKISLLLFVFVILIVACSPAKIVSVSATISPSRTPFKPTAILTSTSSPIPMEIAQIASLGKGSAEFVDWSPDEKFFAIGGSSGAYLYNTATKAEIKFFPYPVLEHIRFSPDSQFIGITDWGTVRIIRINDGAIVATGHERVGVNIVGRVIFSSDSQLFAYIATPSPDGELYIGVKGITTDFFTTLKPDIDYNSQLDFQQISFDSTGKLLFAAASDGLVYAWDLSTGPLKYSLKGHTSEVLGLLLSPDGKLLASYEKGFRVFVWNIETKQRFRMITGYHKEIKKITFSPDSAQLSIIFDDNSMLIRDLASGKTRDTNKYVDADATLLQQYRTTGGYIESINGMAFSPDGQTLAIGSEESAPILLWDISSGKIRATLNAKATKLLYSHQGALLASFVSSNDDRTVFVWDTRNNANLLVINYLTYIDGFAFSSDDSILAVGTDGKIDLWNIQQNKLIKTLQTRGKLVQFLSYSSDGNTLSAVSLDFLADYTYNFFVQSWDGHSGNLTHEFIPANNNTGPLGDIIGLQNDILVVYKHSDVEGYTAELWNVNSGRQLQTLKGINEFGANTLAFNPTATIAAICYVSGINFYDTSTGKLIYFYNKERHSVPALSFSPDGRLFAVGDEEGNILLLDVSHIQESVGSNP